MKWVIAFCLVIIALGVFVEPAKHPIRGEDAIPIKMEHSSRLKDAGGGYPVPATGTTGKYTIITGPTSNPTVVIGPNGTIPTWPAVSSSPVQNEQ